MSNEDFFKKLAKKLKERENPSDLKPSIIGKVVGLNPIIIQNTDNNILLYENEHFELSEWFTFRCNIDKTGALSSTVPSETAAAKAITEVHSYGGSPCNMPNAIVHLANAIEAVAGEVLALKCTLNIGDYVTIASLEENDKYILIDKV